MRIVYLTTKWQGKCIRDGVTTILKHEDNTVELKYASTGYWELFENVTELKVVNQPMNIVL